MTSRADDLARMTVLDADRTPIELGELWRDGTAVLVFVRHFGCILCRDHVAALSRRRDELAAAGATLHIIGNGSPSFIDGFRDALGYDGTIYTDPSLEVYRAAGLKRGVTTVFNLRAAGAALSALRHGQRQGRTQGDNWQQGGVLVVSPAGEILWSHVSGYAGDNAAPDAILAALRARAA
ncbi:MAG: AhpC/TSA family protein [Kofleriaceae bacterium]|nr:AhpC/TSA family protein [Myxococcales bacterium]MCB9560427.1 AhpC/TSA family protein [Kofleriaceae bacterium]MCB9571643.1 AhpC/TSA family protein [Kofleriaceae bacterium]